MADTTYVIGSGERAFWLGLGPQRLAVLGTGVLFAVIAAYSHVPLPMAALPLAAGTAWCFARFQGLPLHELTPAAAFYAVRVITRTHRMAAASPTGELATTERSRELRLPKVCGRLILGRTTCANIELGVLAERGRRGWEIVCLFDVVGDAGFGLLDPGEQHRRMTGWADVLAALSGEYAGRCRLQWIETAARPQRAMPSGDLESLIGSASLCHRTVLAVRVSTQLRDRETATMQAQPLQRLLASRLLNAELVGQPLGREELLQRVTGADPRCKARVEDGPLSIAEDWDCVRLDDTWHRTFLVSAWPRVPVGPTWLGPLLTEGPDVGARNVAMHFQTVRPDVAARRARAARQSASLDVDDRAKLGFGIGARERQGEDQAAAVDEELSAGHVQHRVAGLVGICADSRHDLDEASRQTVAAAGAARLELRPLNGRQADAWAATLPLCRLGHRTAA
jgi:hypothetical protein